MIDCVSDDFATERAVRLDDDFLLDRRRARRRGEEQVASRLGLVCRRRRVGRERRRKEEREELYCNFGALYPEGVTKLSKCDSIDQVRRPGAKHPSVSPYATSKICARLHVGTAD